MATYRMQCTFQHDTAFPRDVLQINPVFDIAGLVSDVDAVCEDLATALDGWHASPGGCEITVRAYDVRGTPPVFPQGEAIRNIGAVYNSPVPRELALCLSFYAERSLPRQRGRVFVPVPAFTGGMPVNRRPGPTQMERAAALAPIFADLGGTNVDWGVWSPTDQEFRSVTNWWVDDEWDIIRSRGGEPLTRVSGTTGEG